MCYSHKKTLLFTNKSGSLVTLPMNAKYQQPCADLRRDPSPLFWRILQTIYEKNTEMNVQMPFSGPIFPEKGPPPFKVLDPSLPLFNQLTTNKSYFFSHLYTKSVVKKTFNLKNCDHNTIWG